MSVPGLDAAARAFLEREKVGRLATADAAGAPHIVPVCYALSGGDVHIAVDEKPKRGDPRRLKRLRNIAENPRAALLVDRYDDADWSRLAWVALRGRAEILGAGEAGAERAAALAALRARYAPYRAMKLEMLPVIAVRIESAAAWGRLAASPS